MNRLDDFQYEEREIAGIKLELAQRGEGRPILFLPSFQGIWKAEPFLEALSRSGRLIVPTHPGFGYSDMPATITAVEDFVYLYLDLLDQLDLQEVVLIGSSLGGWMATEMAIRDRSRIGSLVLIDSLGFKFSGREERDIVDMHGVPTRTLAPMIYDDPEKFGPQYSEFDDEELLRFARAWESFAFIGWKPYMHNPKLARWLHRVSVPTLLLWGAADQIVTPKYGRKIADGISDVRFQLIDRAGHFPYIERPDRVLREIEEFVQVALS